MWLTHDLFILPLTEELGIVSTLLLLKTSSEHHVQEIHQVDSHKWNFLGTFNFNCCQIALWNDWTNLYSHQQYRQFGWPSGLVFDTLRNLKQEASGGSLGEGVEEQRMTAARGPVCMPRICRPKGCASVYHKTSVGTIRHPAKGHLRACARGPGGSTDQHRKPEGII